MSIPISESVVPSAIAAIEKLSSVGVDHKPVLVRETVGSWLVFFANAGQTQPAYCLKVPKPTHLIPPIYRRPDRLPAAIEYEVIVRVHEHFSHLPKLSNAVLRPVAFLADDDAILTEYVSDTSLKEELARRGNIVTSLWNFSGLRRASEMCGTWLSLLHKMDPPDQLPVYRMDSDELQRRTVDAAARLPKPVLRHLPLKRLLGHVQEISPYRSPLAVCHGDFHPGNILVSGPQITVIDLGRVGVRAVEDDLAFFIVHMFAQKERILYGNLAGTPTFIRKLCDAFLTAYGFGPADGWHHLRPWMAVHIVERLAQMSATIDGLPRIVRPILVRRLAAWVRSELPLLFGSEETPAGGSTRIWTAID